MTQTASKPVPVPDTVSATFFDGGPRRQADAAALRQLRLLEFPGARAVPALFRWKPWLARRQWTRHAVHVCNHASGDESGFADSVPYNVSQIDLEEGVRMVANFVGVANEALRIGMKLEVCFEDVGDGVCVPKFRPAAD